MGMGGSDQDGLSSEINVTPLVDVMLVLLVIFMITAPMMNTGVDIDLPETNTVATDESEGRLVLSIGRGRQLYLGATKVSWEELPEKLKTNQRVQSERTLHRSRQRSALLCRRDSYGRCSRKRRAQTSNDD